MKLKNRVSLASEEGFTLIETLIVLFIISLTLIIPVLSINEMIENMRIELFFRELTTDITLMQNHTILTGEATNITYSSTTGDSRIRFHVISQPNHPIERTTIIDPKIGRFNTQMRITIKHNSRTGNSSQFGTIAFFMKTGRYDLKYYIGSARFEIEKVN